MATADELYLLRDLIDEPTDVNGWDDEKLEAYMSSGGGTVEGAAAAIWSAKASAYAALVDVAESGSSRKLGDLFKNAQAMSAYYRGLAPTSAPVDSGSTVVVARIRRGF